MTDIATSTPEITELKRCYGCLAIGLPLTFLPIAWWSMAGIVLMLIGIIWAYVLRSREGASELVHNHGRWQVRTFWISSVFAFIAVMLAGMTVSGNANNAALVKMQEMSAGGQISQDQIEALTNQYMSDNAPVLMWASIGYLSIPIIYAIARFVKGYRLASAGKPVENIKTWAL